MEDQDTSANNTAKVNLTLTKRALDALEPEEKPWDSWDGNLTGLGVRLHPLRAKAFVVNGRAGNRRDISTVRKNQLRRAARSGRSGCAAGLGTV